jgi:hypothetical protein
MIVYLINIQDIPKTKESSSRKATKINLKKSILDYRRKSRAGR